MDNELKVKQARTQQKLEDMLDSLCKMAGRDITVFLPEKVEERIPYLKKEIAKTLEIVN
jgi:hypothetical protein